MDPSIRLIFSRAITAVVVLIAVIFTYGKFKKHQRKSALAAELSLACGESSFFRQFSAEDARKGLVRAVGLVAEAETLGMDINQAVDAGLGINTQWFAEKVDVEDLPMSQQIIRSSLKSNYQNFVKLGYKADFNTIKAMKEGKLPPPTTGPFAGRTPIIKTLIPVEASPGIDKVIANLELCPPDSAEQPLTDIQRTAAKQLARELSSAGIIEDTVRERIIKHLSAPEEKKDK